MADDLGEGKVCVGAELVFRECEFFIAHDFSEGGAQRVSIEVV